MDCVVAFASALLEESESVEPLDTTDEEKTVVTESPFARAEAAPARPARTPSARPRGPRR